MKKKRKPVPEHIKFRRAFAKRARIAAKASDALVELIGAVLHGLPPEVQGATLGELTALWLAGHHPAIRDQVMAVHLGMIKHLIPLCQAKILHEHGGAWPTKQ